MSHTPWNPTGSIKVCPHQCAHEPRVKPRAHPHLSTMLQILTPAGRSFDHLRAQHSCDGNCGTFQVPDMRDPTPYEEVRAWIIWGKALAMHRSGESTTLECNSKEKIWLDRYCTNRFSNSQWNEVLQNALYLPHPPISPWSNGGIGPDFTNVQFPDIALHPSMIPHRRPFDQAAAAKGLPALANGVRQDQPRFLVPAGSIMDKQSAAAIWPLIKVIPVPESALGLEQYSKIPLDRLPPTVPLILDTAKMGAQHKHPANGIPVQVDPSLKVQQVPAHLSLDSNLVGGPSLGSNTATQQSEPSSGRRNGSIDADTQTGSGVSNPGLVDGTDGILFDRFAAEQFREHRRIDAEREKQREKNRQIRVELIAEFKAQNERKRKDLAEEEAEGRKLAKLRQELFRH